MTTVCLLLYGRHTAWPSGYLNSAVCVCIFGFPWIGHVLYVGLFFMDVQPYSIGTFEYKLRVDIHNTELF